MLDDGKFSVSIMNESTKLQLALRLTRLPNIYIIWYNIWWIYLRVENNITQLHTCSFCMTFAYTNAHKPLRKHFGNFKFEIFELCILFPTVLLTNGR